MRAAAFAAAAALAALAGGCGPRLDLGSDLLWTGLFEGGTLDEWTADGAGSTFVYPTTRPNVVEVTEERVHGGVFAAKLTVDAPQGADQASAGLSRAGAPLPVTAYYSAWYYLPRSVDVAGYWVIFKLRQRDDSTMDELYDLDLITLDTGEMSLQLYDHRHQTVVPLSADAPIVPVGRWFQIEAFYRNAQDATGRLTFWLDGLSILDIENQPMGTTPWVEWNACSIGKDLTPSTTVVYVDDCAVSRTRVGPNGFIAN
jgi:hypothetical protein